MGNNLSSTFKPDLSKVVLSPGDRRGDTILGVAWLGCLYAIAVIFSTCALVDRWKGPRDQFRVGPSGVLGALILSIAWPVVMVYLMSTGGL